MQTVFWKTADSLLKSSQKIIAGAEKGPEAKKLVKEASGGTLFGTAGGKC